MTNLKNLSFVASSLLMAIALVLSILFTSNPWLLVLVTGLLCLWVVWVDSRFVSPYLFELEKDSNYASVEKKLLNKAKGLVALVFGLGLIIVGVLL